MLKTDPLHRFTAKKALNHFHAKLDRSIKSISTSTTFNGLKRKNTKQFVIKVKSPSIMEDKHLRKTLTTKNKSNVKENEKPRFRCSVEKNRPVVDFFSPKNLKILNRNTDLSRNLRNIGLNSVRTSAMTAKKFVLDITNLKSN